MILLGRVDDKILRAFAPDEYTLTVDILPWLGSLLASLSSASSTSFPTPSPMLPAPVYFHNISISTRVSTLIYIGYTQFTIIIYVGLGDDWSKARRCRC